MSDYPEHEKLSVVKDKSQAIGEFLDWLSEQQVRLARYEDAAHSDAPRDLIVGRTPDGQPIFVNDETGEESQYIRSYQRREDSDYWYKPGGFYPINERIEAILAEYFEIDLNKIESEKRAMLDELRTANAARHARQVSG